MDIIAAILLGIFGSFHCVGMCGPIALALPLDRSSVFSKIAGGFTYNIGRILTYTVLGILLGTLGKGFVIAGFQQTLSIAVGVSILVMLLFSHYLPSTGNYPKIYSFIGKLKNKVREKFQISSYSSLFTIGLLNGLLPCGLVYLGIAGAIATGDSIKGGIFMMLFGLGTVPAMLSVSLMSNLITIGFRNKIKKAMPVFIICMALLLILRGLNLGIPYVSPKMSATTAECHKCCKE
jgi:sulfite exporter TauE/SafE